jgi:hypothetical protein
VAGVSRNSEARSTEEVRKTSMTFPLIRLLVTFAHMWSLRCQLRQKLSASLILARSWSGWMGFANTSK